MSRKGTCRRLRSRLDARKTATVAVRDSLWHGVNHGKVQCLGPICGTAENGHKDGLLVKRGFGYIHHLAPIKKTAARFAGYFTSYLTKTWKELQDEKKRVRLITYARNILRCASVNFSWNGPNGINWRRKKRMFAFSCGCFSFESAKEKAGRYLVV